MSKKSENNEMSSNLFKLIEKANRLEVLGKIDEAIKYYEDSLTIETREEILIQLGFLYHRIGNLDNSLWLEDRVVNIPSGYRKDNRDE